MNQDALWEVNKVYNIVIKEVMKRIKPDKSDPIWDFSSDLLKNSPEILYDNLAILLQAFLVHRHVSDILLLATLVPIVEDKLSDLSSTKNYRSIVL